MRSRSAKAALPETVKFIWRRSVAVKLKGFMTVPAATEVSLLEPTIESGEIGTRTGGPVVASAGEILRNPDAD